MQREDGLLNQRTGAISTKNLASFFDSLDITPDNRWAWENYKPLVLSAIDYFGFKNVFEVGGGRRPLLSAQEISDRGLNYTVNDIDQNELDLLDDSYKNVCCANIAETPVAGSYDFIFSRMVYEHVENNKRSLSNQLSMLNAGGIVVHFHPVLYAFPFVVNHMLPEKQARQLFDLIFAKSRTGLTQEEKLKFPTYYDWCTATKRQKSKIQEVGFSEVELVPIYGHEYYRYVPVVRDVHRTVSGFLASADVRMLASYCFTTARK